MAQTMTTHGVAPTFQQALSTPPTLTGNKQTSDLRIFRLMTMMDEFKHPLQELMAREREGMTMGT
ncbi:hypothetical protein, partial [Bifidobacterium reuteri]|uniref:hypothetical protein n=1 Tax=Bifidobacterium reuteri TaxID=983706 RepID=UPI001CC30EA4